MVIQGAFIKMVKMPVGIAVSFFMTPFILHHLGDRMYGLWILAGVFMTYGGYLDLGIASAVGRFVARALGRQDLKDVNEVVNTAFVVFLLLGGVVLGITIALASTVDLFVPSPEERGVVRLLILLLGLNLAIGFPTRAFGGVIGATLRFTISEGIYFLEFLLRNLLILVLFSLGYGIIALATTVFISSLLSYTLFTIFAFRVLEGLRLDIKDFRRERVRELLSYGIFTFLYKVSEILIFRLDALVISSFVGLVAVAHYSIASTIVSIFIYLMVNTVGLIRNVLSQDEGKGDREGIKRKFKMTTKISLYMALFIGAMLILYGCPFILRWIGEGYTDSCRILTILVPPVTLWLIQMPSNALLFAIGRHRFLAGIQLMEGLFNLLLSLILVRYYGIVGVALGTAIPMVVGRMLAQPLYVCRVLEMNTMGYYSLIVRNIVIGIFGIIPVYLVLYPHLKPDYLVIGGSIALQGMVYLGTILLLGFNPEERGYLGWQLKASLQRLVPGVAGGIR